MSSNRTTRAGVSKLADQRRSRHWIQRAKSIFVSLSVHLGLLLFLSWFFISSRVQQTVSFNLSAGSGDVGETLQILPAMTQSLETVSSDESPSDIELFQPTVLLTSFKSQDLGPKPEPAAIDFFGSQAYGNRFVFVLDISTSMNARHHERIARAREELLRAVSNLSPQQSYYVFLFCWETIPMYGGQSREFVHAEEGHLEKLRYWLNKAKLGGGTDPRRALVFANAMHPDAIFLLSDGQFNRRNNGPAGWANHEGIPVGASVEDGVEAALSDIPIHTIAFENPYTRQTMQQIADVSNGSCRYVKTQSLQPVNTHALIRQLRNVRQRRDIRWEGEEGKHAIRLRAAKTLVEEGELAFAEYVARPIGDFPFEQAHLRMHARELFEILDDELGDVRLEDFPEFSIHDVERELLLNRR